MSLSGHSQRGRPIADHIIMTGQTNYDGSRIACLVYLKSLKAKHSTCIACSTSSPMLGLSNELFNHISDLLTA